VAVVAVEVEEEVAVEEEGAAEAVAGAASS
jgi:hypothetical protein